jgi:hypothetical protein
LIGIILKISIYLDNIDIITILKPPIHENGISLYFFKTSLIF